MKFSWRDITVKQFKEMQGKEPEEIFEILFGSIPLQKLNKLEIDMDGDIPIELPRAEYLIDGKVFEFQMDLREFTTAQYIDFTSTRDILVQLNAVLKPKGGDEEYGKTFHQELEKMSIVDALSVLHFFQMSWQTSLKAMRKYLKKNKMKIQLTQLKMLEDMVSYYSSKV